MVLERAEEGVGTEERGVGRQGLQEDCWAERWPSLELQRVMSCHVSAGNKTQVLWKSSLLLSTEPPFQSHHHDLH